MTIEIYKTELGEWRWRRVNAKGMVVKVSPQGWTRFDDCHRMASVVTGRADSVTVLPRKPSGR